MFTQIGILITWFDLNEIRKDKILPLHTILDQVSMYLQNNWVEIVEGIYSNIQRACCFFYYFYFGTVWNLLKSQSLVIFSYVNYYFSDEITNKLLKQFIRTFCTITVTYQLVLVSKLSCAPLACILPLPPSQKNLFSFTVPFFFFIYIIKKNPKCFKDS